MRKKVLICLLAAAMAFADIGCLAHAAQNEKVITDEEGSEEEEETGADPGMEGSTDSREDKVWLSFLVTQWASVGSFDFSDSSTKFAGDPLFAQQYKKICIEGLEAMSFAATDYAKEEYADLILAMAYTVKTRTGNIVNSLIAQDIPEETLESLTSQEDFSIGQWIPRLNAGKSADDALRRLFREFERVCAVYGELYGTSVDIYSTDEVLMQAIQAVAYGTDYLKTGPRYSEDLAASYYAAHEKEGVLKKYDSFGADVLKYYRAVRLNQYLLDGYPSATDSASIIKAAQEVSEKILSDGDWHWFERGYATTWEAAKQTSHKTGCAHYVSMIMQVAGLFPRGVRIYTDPNTHTLRYQGSGAEAAVKKNFEIYTFNSVRFSNLDMELKTGDIVGGHFASGTQHNFLIAGKNDKGWYDIYDAGSGSTTNSSKAGTKGTNDYHSIGTFNNLLYSNSTKNKGIYVNYVLRPKGDAGTGSAGSGKKIWFGDSRTVGLGSLVLGYKSSGNAIMNDGMVAKVSAGYAWANSEGYVRLKEALNKNKTASVIINFGVNDLGNKESYVKLYKKIHTEFPQAKLYFMSVNPTGKGYSGGATNAKIDSFNAYMKSHVGQFGGTYIDTNKGLSWPSSYYVKGGLHYSKKGYTAIAEYVSKG